MVVIVDGNQVAELQVAGQGASLTRDTLHQATIAEEAVCVVVDQVEARLVVDGSGVGLGNGKTNSVADTLAQRTSGYLDTGGVVGLGVARSDAVNVLKVRCQRVVCIGLHRRKMVQNLHGRP